MEQPDADDHTEPKNDQQDPDENPDQHNQVEITIPAIDCTKLPNYSGPVHIPSKLTKLPDNVKCLHSPNGATVYLIGTAHVSTQSAEEVVEVIRLVKPNTVLVELCKRRINVLFQAENTSSDSTNKAKDAPKQETQRMLPKTNILQWLLSSLYSNLMGQLKVRPGQEFQVAFQEATNLGSLVVLGDRPIDITLQRTWSALSLWEKIKLGCLLLSSFEIKPEDVERLKNTDLVTEMAKELGREFPTIKHQLLNERDMFLAGTLKRCSGPVVVGVVGLGHVEGIEKNWSKQVDFEELTKMPPESTTSKLLKKPTVRVALAGVSIGTLYFCGYGAYLAMRYSPIPFSLALFLTLTTYTIKRTFFPANASEVIDKFEKEVQKKKNSGKEKE